MESASTKRLVIYYQYRADQARRTLHGIDELNASAFGLQAGVFTHDIQLACGLECLRRPQIAKAEKAVAGKTAVKRTTRGSPRHRSDRQRLVATHPDVRPQPPPTDQPRTQPPERNLATHPSQLTAAARRHIMTLMGG